MQQDGLGFGGGRRIGERAAPTSDSLSLPQQRSLHEIVAERLVAAIEKGELRPGERLVEVGLANRLGVSRAPLREALKLLEAQGMVESRRGRGTFVRAVTPEQIADMLAMRAMLEGFAARQCTARATDPDIARLTGLHRDLESAHSSGNLATARDLDWRFHECVCRLSGNAYLVESWLSLAMLLRVFGDAIAGRQELPRDAIDRHRAYLKVLQSRNADRAEHVFRSTILISGFGSLGRPVPESLSIYL